METSTGGSPQDPSFRVLFRKIHNELGRIPESAVNGLACDQATPRCDSALELAV